MNKVPNKYNLSPLHLNRLYVLDWPRLKKETWHNKFMNNGTWWCHLEGSQFNGEYDETNEFWIGFEEKTGKVNSHFSTYEGMCRYKFNTFYDEDEIKDEYELNVQINALRWLNKMIDEKILGVQYEVCKKTYRC